MIKTLILLLILSSVDVMATIQEQNQNELEHINKSMEQYFDALRSKKIVQAQNILNTNPKWNERDMGNDLLQAYQGIVIELKEKEVLSSKINKLFLSLSNGYYYQNSKEMSALGAYKSFSSAIQLANEIDFIPGLKFSLISMLNLLNKEVFLGTDKFLPYLNHYKEIKSDEIDELIISLFEISLKAKENADFNSTAQSRKFMKQFDELFSKIPDKNPFKIQYIYRKGIQAKIKKEYNEALLHLRKTAELTANIQMERSLHETVIWQLSSVHNLLKDSDSALFYLNKSRRLSSDLRSEFYDDRLASWIYNEIGMLDSAYYFLNRSIETEYKLNAKTNSLESSLLAIENQTEKLKSDKLRLDNRRKTNQNYLIATISLLIMGTLTAIFIQKNTTKKRLLAEQEVVLKQQRVDNLLKEQELVSIDAMIAGQEKERQKVAGELHDDLGSLMATIKLHFDNAKINKKDPALQNAQKLLEEAYQKIRGMAHSKNSGVMSNQGLLPAIKKMAKTISETSALEVVVEDFGMGERMENSLELSIFRMVQELVANAIKHAEASKVNIQLTQHEDNLNIIVEDNGKGFDMSQVEKTGNGMGLTNIEKRVEHLEGSFTVDSIIGKGTSILIDIPV